MNNEKIFINSDNLIEITYKLKSKINDIKQCYEIINNEITLIDGSQETWQGNSQQKYYEGISPVINEYEKNLNKLTEMYNFLCKAIMDYEQRDEDINIDIENSDENLSI